MTDNKTNFGKKYTFFKPDYCINFQAVVSTKKFATVNVEIAPVYNNTANWDQKISLQLSEKDLYVVFTKLTQKAPLKYESKFHGPKKNKSISFDENLQTQGCTITLKEAGNVTYFECGCGEWFYGKLLMMEQLLGHGLSMEEAGQLLPAPVQG